MPKLRHIALATQDPEATAEFYKQAFGFKEVGKVVSELGRGFYLSDGTLNIAVLKFMNTDQLGKGLDYVGLHHFGVLVDDVDEWTAKLESLGAACFLQAPKDRANNNFEVKFRGPDGVVFDIADHPWPGSAPAEESAVQAAAIDENERRRIDAPR
jgi:catechol 2,3-dioxygenase-like lactoylglutathione lyase family enzyme